MSRAVLEATGTVLTNKYSEGYPGKRYYEGQQVIDPIERLAIDRAQRLFGVDHANVQPYSGSPANLAVYAAFLEPGDTVMGMHLSMGGHLTHGWRVSVTGKWFRSVQYGVRRDTGRVDLDEVRDLARSRAAQADLLRRDRHPPHHRLPRLRRDRPTRWAPCWWPTSPTSPGWWPAAPTRRRWATPTSSPPPPTRRCADRAAP